MAAAPLVHNLKYLDVSHWEIQPDAKVTSPSAEQPLLTGRITRYIIGFRTPAAASIFFNKLASEGITIARLTNVPSVVILSCNGRKVKNLLVGEGVKNVKDSSREVREGYLTSIIMGTKSASLCFSDNWATVVDRGDELETIADPRLLIGE